MNAIRTFSIGALMLGAFALVRAADIPEPGERDSRVRYVTYKKDEVTAIQVRRGSVTRIVLGDDEKLVVAASGFTSDCAKGDTEWCIVAEAGTNQIWIKPKDGATHNNLEVRTSKRDYSFELMVLPDARIRGNRSAGLDEARSPMFRVIFRHAVELPSLSTLVALAETQSHPAPAAAASGERRQLEDRIQGSKPEPRNTNYSLQVLKGGEDIAPSMVFDDGKFTYFQFAGNREIPAIFYLSASGEEGRTNFHMAGDGLVAVQRTGQRFVLRLGDAVVGVWNEAFDADGVPSQNGTNVVGVRRITR